MKDVSQINGFGPIADATAQVLILGSMPSVASLQKQQYYGHRRNAFWPIMMRLFSASADNDYERRKQILLANHVAVWDVLQSCQRSGSLDADIDAGSIKTNDFTAFYREHSAIRQVFFNGAMAEKIYKQRVLPQLGNEFAYLVYKRLPSTSPAHAAKSLSDKYEAWRVIRECVNTN